MSNNILNFPLGRLFAFNFLLQGSKYKILSKKQ